MRTAFQTAIDLGELGTKVGRLYAERFFDANSRSLGRFTAAQAKPQPSMPANPWEVWLALPSDLTDQCQCSVLFWDTMRGQRNQYLDHERVGNPPFDLLIEQASFRSLLGELVDIDQVSAAAAFLASP